MLDDGWLEIIDPSFSDIPLLREINPDFRIETAPLWNFTSPRFQRSRNIGCGLTQNKLRDKEEDWLWSLHDELCLEGKIGLDKPGESSLLDLKIELARRQLSSCNLCARRCGVNRFNAEVGLCGLGPEAYVGECFPHIAEEPPINPSYIINLYGCGLRCRHCQQAHLIDASSLKGDLLETGLWNYVMNWPVRSLSFAGGDPDENLYAVLKFLNSAPDTFKHPVVWNCHGYSTPPTIKLLEGVVDTYVPDFKYWDYECACKLSGAPDYGQVALAAIEQMLHQKVPVIARILVLPGHIDCCHLPVIEALSKIKAENLRISIRDQYCPDNLVNLHDGPLARRARAEEVNDISDYAMNLGIMLV